MDLESRLFVEQVSADIVHILEGGVPPTMRSGFAPEGCDADEPEPATLRIPRS